MAIKNNLRINNGEYATREDATRNIIIISRPYACAYILTDKMKDEQLAPVKLRTFSLCLGTLKTLILPRRKVRIAANVL